MLTKLVLKNFRGFREHTVPFRAASVIVGRNNAGKSTIIEALRLLSIVVSRYRFLTFYPVPNWLEIPVRNRGITPSLDSIEFDFDNVCHRYGDPPATIIGSFSSGERVEIYLNPLKRAIYAVVRKKNGDPLISKSQAAALPLPGVSILPQIGPLARSERILVSDYVRQHLDSNLASIHFRNQLNLISDHFAEFGVMAEDSWPGFRVQEFNGRAGEQGRDLTLMVRDGSFVAEVGWMGHGLQIWLQTIWFLARSSPSDTVILDEPDIYLHADLQRKIMRLIRRRHRQVIVATHSIEIMAEVTPDDILIVDKSQKSSKFATSVPAVQAVIDHMGGVHNLQLARLWMARKCILVEGDDVSFLKIFQDKLFPESGQPIDVIPNIPIGGWGNWKLAVGSSMLLKNAGDQSIRAYCILDRDYHTQEEVGEVQAEARRHGLQLHVWIRKELENYLVVPQAIQRLVASKVAKDVVPPTVLEVTNAIDELCELQKNAVTDAIGQELLARNRAAGFPVANALTRVRMDQSWTSVSGKVAIVSGKQLLSDLSERSKRRFNVSFGRMSVAEALHVEEVDNEVRKVITAIESAAEIHS